MSNHGVDAFIRSSKFLRHTLSPTAADIHALLVFKRDSLLKSKKINEDHPWFFYHNSDLLFDLGNDYKSINSVKKHLDKLVNYGLIHTRINEESRTVKQYLLNDEAYRELFKKHGSCWKINQEMISVEEVTDEGYEPL